MKAVTLIHFSFILLMNPHRFLGRKRYLFVLSHMRSYSSLLCHILGTNPDISGYSELHRSYRKYGDILRMKYKVFLSNNNSLDGRYVLDKILHNEHCIDFTYLSNHDVYFIIAVREPDSSIKSIINMGNKQHDSGWFTDPDQVVSYYVGRLNKLVAYGDYLKEKFFFFRAEEILLNTDSLLSKFSSWLDLSEPLIKEYRQFSKTGKPVYGDTSKNIRIGAISTSNLSTYKNIYVPDRLLTRARQAYQESIEKLSQYSAD